MQNTLFVPEEQHHIDLKGYGKGSDIGSAVGAAHNYLFKEAGLDPAHAYDEIIRVLAALAYERRNGLERCDDLSEHITQSAAGVLDHINIEGSAHLDFGRPTISSDVLEGLVQMLANINLDSVETEDPFGVIFQQVVTSTFRASLGAYFTPTPIADFVAEVLAPEDGALVVDPAAGSGGLLTAAARSASRKGRSIRFGALDINPRMVLTEALNFYVAEAGVDRLVLGDGLVDFPCDFGAADVVVANPPFAGFERRPEVLEGYRTANLNGTIRSLNKTIPFVERIVDLLRPGGRAGLVVPISIFNAEEASFVGLRKLLMESCEIDAVFSLPTVAFEHTDCGITGGLLFLTKRARPRRSYPIFLAQIESVGYDSLGYPVPENDFPNLLAAYTKGTGSEFVDSREIPAGERIDPQWWSPGSRALRTALSEGTQYVPLTSICRVKRAPLDRKATSAEERVEYFEVRDTDPEFGVIVASHEMQGSHLARKGRIKQVVHTGDVLLPNHKDSLTSKAGSGSGRSAVLVSDAFDGVATTDRFIILESLVEPNILIGILNSEVVRRQLVMLARGSASLDIRASVLNDVMIPDLADLPTEGVQSLARAVADFRGLRDEIIGQRAEVEALVGSLLNPPSRTIAL